MMAYQTNYKPRQTNAFEVINNVHNNLNHLINRLFQQQDCTSLDLSKVRLEVRSVTRSENSWKITFMLDFSNTLSSFYNRSYQIKCSGLDSISLSNSAVVNTQGPVQCPSRKPIICKSLQIHVCTFWSNSKVRTFQSTHPENLDLTF